MENVWSDFLFSLKSTGCFLGFFGGTGLSGDSRLHTTGPSGHEVVRTSFGSIFTGSPGATEYSMADYPRGERRTVRASPDHPMLLTSQLFFQGADRPRPVSGPSAVQSCYVILFLSVLELEWRTVRMLFANCPCAIFGLSACYLRTVRGYSKRCCLSWFSHLVLDLCIRIC
jgi:hypothetical protein